MRKVGLWIALAALVVLVVVSWLFMDRWIEGGLEKAGEAAVGAKVEIDNLDFSLAGLRLHWDRLQVANPQRTLENVLETGPATFDMSMQALLRGRVVIDAMTLAGARSGTARATDGALPKKPKPQPKADAGPSAWDKAQARLSQEIAALPVMQFDPDRLKAGLNVDSLMAAAHLQSPAQIDSLKGRIAGVSRKWKDFYAEFHPQEELEGLRADWAATDLSKVNTVPEILLTLNKIRKSRDKLSTLGKTLDQKQEEMQADFATLGFDFAQVEKWVDADYQRLLAQAKVPDFSVGEIGKVVFGPVLVQKVNTVLGGLAKARALMPARSEKTARVKPARSQGQDIPFEDRHGWPRFLLRHAALSGEGVQDSVVWRVDGEITDLCTQPWVIGRPTVLALQAAQVQGFRAGLKGVLDHAAEPAQDRFDVDFKGYPLVGMALGQSPYLPQSVGGGLLDGTLGLALQGERLDLEMHLVARKLVLDFGQVSSTGPFMTLLRESLQELDALRLDIVVRGQLESPQLTIQSNLDRLVSSRLAALGSRAVSEAQAQIRRRLDAQLAGRLSLLDEVYAQSQAGALTRMEGDQTALSSLKQEIQKAIKDLEKRI